MTSATLDTPVGIHRYGDHLIYASQNAGVVRLVELGGSLSVGDDDGGALTASFSVNNGILSVVPSGSATISSGANTTSSLSIQGSVEDLNTSLATLEYQGFPDFHGTDTLTYSVSDGANSTEDATLSITINSINDVPEIGGVVILEGNEDETFSIFSPGQVSTLAGTGVAGEADGAGNVATFNAPIGLAVDSQGNVIVTDHLKDKIRKIAPDGTVSTLAGNGVAVTVDGNGLNTGFDRPTGITLDLFDTIFLVECNGTVVRSACAGQFRAIQIKLCSLEICSCPPLPNLNRSFILGDSRIAFVASVISPGPALGSPTDSKSQVGIPYV